jgi:nitric oxide reductase subunit B
MYIGIQYAYGIERMKATFKSKMGVSLIAFGVMGMTIALTIAGYEQVLIERAELGGGWNAFFTAQEMPWYVQAQLWRAIMGVVTFVGFIYLVWDLLTIGKAQAKKTASE